jgi:hypothetical protein
MLRQNADDPQIQLAEDTAAALARGQSSAGGSGYLHERLPGLPAGIFSYARQHSVDRVTWQPEPGVRSAIVVVSYGGGQPGFVMAGRSLRDTERRADNLLGLTALGWLLTVAASLVVVAVVELALGRT